MDSNQKGNVAELKIAAAATELGIGVFKPLGEHGRADLIFEVGPQLLRVQCKWARRRRSKVIIASRGSWHSPSRGYVRSSYSPEEIDIIAAYCPDTGSCYAIPVCDFPNQTQVDLRLAPAENNQRAALHFASDYPLGAVAQLAERMHGMHEAGGSNPPSSTPQEAAAGGAVNTVGAHIFRNHFGWYMQRAAAGESFNVTRRGRPFARLVPPSDQLPAEASREEVPRLRLVSEEQLVAAARDQGAA